MGCRSCESTIDEPGDKAVEALPRAAAACLAPPDCQPSRPPSAQTETSAATTAAGPFGPGLKNGVQARPATTASPLPLAGPHSRCFVVETREKRPPMQIACCCRQGLGPRAQHGLSPCDRVSTRHPLSPATRVARVVTACTRSTVCLVLDSCPRIQRAAQITGRRAAAKKVQDTGQRDGASVVSDFRGSQRQQTASKRSCLMMRMADRNGDSAS